MDNFAGSKSSVGAWLMAAGGVLLLIAAVTEFADGDVGRGLFVFIVAGAVLSYAGIRIYRRNAGRPGTPGSTPPPPGDPEAR